MANPGSGRLERIRSAIDLYQGPLIAFANRITGDLESARDVVQDTFLRLCQEDLDRIADHLAAWLFCVCRNRALDVRKKEGPLEPLGDGHRGRLEQLRDDPHRLLETSDRTRLVLAAVAELPLAQQEVLRLRFQQELSYREISAVTSLTIGNVGFLIHTGIRRVRQRLGEGSTRTRAERGRSDA
jgi:RNA polymerase sigma factor (sigma-70 family)